ncbi:MAG: hypothetical protein GXP41_08910 [Chloroflexi bacterium]|nr:hypothetical protein [Chloroflexota bacterium]
MPKVNFEEFFEDIVELVELTEEDIQLLKEIGTIVEPYTLEATDFFFGTLQAHPSTAQYLEDLSEAEWKRIRIGFGRSFMGLFSGQYDANYSKRLWRGSLVFYILLRFDPAHMITARGLLRRFVISKIGEEVTDREKLLAYVIAFNRMMDLDLAHLVAAYSSALLDTAGWRLGLTKRLAAQGASRMLKNLHIE